MCFPERYAFNVVMMTDTEILEAVKKKLGGNAGVADKLGTLTPQAVSQWKRIPPSRVLDVERLTGISRHDLRSDIFGPAAPQEASAA